MAHLLENIEHIDGGTSRIGSFGEACAAEYLRIRGYSIVATNFKAVIGRNRKGVAFTGEIDIVAIDSGVLCFVEVKTRSSQEAAPESAVTLRKQRQITRTARAYLRAFGIGRMPKRFDVIAVTPRGTRAPSISHLKDFWSPERFRKRIWCGDGTVNR